MKYQEGDIAFLVSAKEMKEVYRKLCPRSNNDDFLKHMLPHAGKQFTISSVHNTDKITYSSKESYENIDEITCWAITEEFLAILPDHDFIGDSQENITKLFQ